MGKLLQIIGACWAVIGALNLFLMPWATAGEGLLTLGLFVNVLFFIFPGLGLYGLGSMLSKRLGGP